MKRKYKTVCIRGKVCDGYEMYFRTGDGQNREIGELYYEGYAPAMMKPVDNDYIEFNIDIATGQILNWPKKALTVRNIERAAQWVLAVDAKTGLKGYERRKGK